LLEASQKSGLVFGFTDDYIRVGVTYSPKLAGKVVEVRLNSLDSRGFMNGEIV
jgi:hypothetical protein